MGGIDQDNFSNISWQSDRLRPASSGSSAAHHHGGQDPEQPAHDQPEPEPNFSRMVVHGLGDELLECNVSSPLKENDGTKDAFVSYLVTTHTTFPDFQKPDVSVRRRFTDFVFLFKTLSREYPASAVPPLPDKQRMEYVRGDRFGNDFTSRRAYSLRRFLARCSLHPVLRRSAILHTFLESPDWNATMRSRASRSVSMSGNSSGESGSGHYGSGSAGGGGGSGGGNSLANSVFDNFADTFINAFTKVHKPDRRFIEVREKSDKLDEDLSHVEKVVARVSRRETDMEADHKDLAEQFQKLIVLEPGVEGPVRAFAASVEDTAQGLRGLREVTEQDYLGSLRDLAAYSGALKNLLKAREQKQLDFEQLTEYLNKSSAERDVLASGGYSSGGALAGAGGFIRSKIEDVRGVDHEQSRRERLRKLELRIEELTVEVERAKKTSELFDEEVIREVSDFERIKRVELKRQFGSLAQSHTDFYDATIDVWEKYVKEMEKEGAVAL